MRPHLPGSGELLSASGGRRALLVVRSDGAATWWLLVEADGRWQAVGEYTNDVDVPLNAALPSPTAPAIAWYDYDVWRLGHPGGVVELPGFTGGAWSGDGLILAGPGGAFDAEGRSLGPVPAAARATNPALWCGVGGRLWYVKGQDRWSWAPGEEPVLEDPFPLAPKIAERTLDRPLMVPIVWSPSGERVLWKDRYDKLLLGDARLGGETDCPDSWAWGFVGEEPAGLGPEPWGRTPPGATSIGGIGGVVWVIEDGELRLIAP